MNSKTYVSDPKIWEAFYKNMAENKFNPYKYRPRQKGKGWSFKKSYRIPLRAHSEFETQPNVPLITQVAAVEERVKQEYKKEVQEGNPHVVPGKSLNTKAKNIRISSKQNPQQLTSNRNRSRKPGKRPATVRTTFRSKKTKGAASPRNTAETDYRELRIDKHGKNVFSKQQ